MREKFAKLGAWLKVELAAFGRAWKKAEAWIKSTAAVVVGGGCSAALDFYRTGQHFELSMAHFVQVKTQFLGGAFLTLLALWTHSPRDKTPPTPPQ